MESGESPTLTAAAHLHTVVILLKWAYTSGCVGRCQNHGNEA